MIFVELNNCEYLLTSFTNIKDSEECNLFININPQIAHRILIFNNNNIDFIFRTN